MAVVGVVGLLRVGVVREAWLEWGASTAGAEHFQGKSSRVRQGKMLFVPWGVVVAL